MKRNLSAKPAGGRGWLLFLVLGLLACMVMGLVLVWSNIERMDTTYFINIAQDTCVNAARCAPSLKLKGNACFRYELRRRAKSFSMREPKPGQIRRMEARSLRSRIRSRNRNVRQDSPNHTIVITRKYLG